jgi:hypothetical protein
MSASTEQPDQSFGVQAANRIGVEQLDAQTKGEIGDQTKSSKEISKGQKLAVETKPPVLRMNQAATALNGE